MSASTPVAIVGIGGLFPQAADLRAFRRNVLEGRDAVREVPPGRWIVDPRAVHQPTPAPDRAYSTRGCFLDEFDLCTDGLNIDPERAGQLDPLYKIVLHAGRQAFQDAVLAPLDLARVGVALAAIALPSDSSSRISRAVLEESFARRVLGDKWTDTPVSSRSAADNARVTGLPASLLASALGLGGGAYTLDAACASSLYAIKLACDELRAGRADAMLAGGVSRPDCLYTQIGFSQLRALSPSGICRPFDADADGLIVGEGAGVVVLKRLEDALRDGDRVYGLVRGIGLSNDIAGSLLAADSEGQLRAMRQAYEQAGWHPTDVDFIECHGTGTPLGDAAEIASLQELWGDARRANGPCILGSVKSIIGHLLTAAGAAGLIKTLLAMQAEQLPPSANVRRLAPSLDSADPSFRVLDRSAPWKRRDVEIPRRAAVSAFGFGGINAHLLIEECVQREGQVVRQIFTTPEPTRIAIVGMGTHIGRADTVRKFQEIVLGGRTEVGDRPADRWRGCDDVAHEALGSPSYRVLTLNP